MGLLFQILGAFVSVQGSFSFFITTYAQLAAWKVTIDRLTGFDAAMSQTEVDAATPPLVDVVRGPGSECIEVDALDIRLPDGRRLVEECRFTVDRGDLVLVSGPSGAGKSTLFRALAGIWPYGSGSVTFPRDAQVMIVPQRPYLPLGTLAAAIAFPQAPDRWSREEIVGAVEAAGLGAFIAQLDVEELWGQRLSLGEQQRVAIARALLHRPDVLLLDEASEHRLYVLLRTQLPQTTIVSIGHRSSLRAFHRRHLRFVHVGGSGRVVEEGGSSGAPGPALSGASPPRS
jgi:putative ATP-binding cassette transporter